MCFLCSGVDLSGSNTYYPGVGEGESDGERRRGQWAGGYLCGGRTGVVGEGPEIHRGFEGHSGVYQETYCRVSSFNFNFFFRFSKKEGESWGTFWLHSKTEISLNLFFLSTFEEGKGILGYILASLKNKNFSEFIFSSDFRKRKGNPGVHFGTIQKQKLL